jgi:ribosomal protein S16
MAPKSARSTTSLQQMSAVRVMAASSNSYYNPMVAADVAPIVELKEDRVRYWLGVGAQPTDKVHHILLKSGLIEATTKAEG